MGLLGERFRAQDSKSKSSPTPEAVFDVQYPTRFLPFDYLNGYRVHVTPPVGEPYDYTSIGIVDGSSTTFIGRSGSGKTTAAVQFAANIVRPFPDADIFFRDIEGGSNVARRQVLTRFTPTELDERMDYANEGISAESVFNDIYKIYEEKTTHRDEYEYDTGLVDNLGRRIYKLIPTVFILDSLAMLTPEKIAEEDELSGQMSATSMAKANAGIFKRIIPKLKAANIILFVINHINDKIELNPFSHTKAQIAYLKPDETLPGGKAALYLANNMIRVDDGAKLKAEEGLGVSGKLVDFSIIKSRTNSSGRSVPMVFTSDNGFDEILSMFMFLKSTGGIEMKGATCTLRGFPDVKFTQKTFKQKLISDPEFVKIFNEVVKTDLESLLAPSLDYEVQNSYQGIIDSILG